MTTRSFAIAEYVKFLFIWVGAPLLIGCQPDEKPPAHPPVPQAPPSVLISVDVSTPDRALKSYWLSKDALRRAQSDWSASHATEFQKLGSKIGYDAPKIMTGEAFRSQQNKDVP